MGNDAAAAGGAGMTHFDREFERIERETAERIEKATHQSRAGNKDHVWAFSGRTKSSSGAELVCQRCLGCSRTRKIYQSTGKVYRP